MNRRPQASALFPYTTLFGSDELAPRLHWGANLVYERVLGGARDAEYALTAGLSYTLEDQRFSVGAELNVELAEDRKSTRLNSSHLVISYAVFCLKQKSPFGV